MYAIVVGPPGTGKSPTTNNTLKEFIRYVVDIPTVNALMQKVSEEGAAYFVNTEFHEIMFHI